jgi:hypothetical protein
LQPGISLVRVSFLGDGAARFVLPTNAAQTHVVRIWRILVSSILSVLDRENTLSGTLGVKAMKYPAAVLPEIDDCRLKWRFHLRGLFGIHDEIHNGRNGAFPG